MDQVVDTRKNTFAETKRALRDLLGERRVRDGDSDRDLHGKDLSFHTPHRPDVVVYPESTDEVSRVLAIANELNVPVTAFGAGSSLEGHVIPLRGGISLNLTAFNLNHEASTEN